MDCKEQYESSACTARHTEKRIQPAQLLIGGGGKLADAGLPVLLYLPIRLSHNHGLCVRITSCSDKLPFGFKRRQCSDV